MQQGVHQTVPRALRQLPSPSACTLGHAVAQPCKVHRSRDIRAWDSVREPKDPKAFKDMDTLRAHLEKQGRPGFISGLINWVSNSSFGLQGGKQPWWSPAGLYRALTGGSLWGWKAPQSDIDLGPEDPNAPLTAAVTRQHQALAPLLLLSRSDMRRMAQRYPPVLDMSASEVAMRLVHLREALPGCNTPLLLEQYPQLFLSGDAEQTKQQVAAAAQQLVHGLKGAAVADVIMFDPEILFMDLEHGLKELRDLWDVDEQTMADSEPKHLALAVRAMCDSGKGQGEEELLQPSRALKPRVLK